MIHVIPKWQVDITLSSGQRRSVWLSDNFIENVMRQVASMQFDANPLVRVVAVHIFESGTPPETP